MPRKMPNREKEVISQCLKTLRSLQGSKVEFKEESTKPFGGRLYISGPWGEIAFRTGVATRLTPATMNLLIHQMAAFHAPDGNPLLLSDYIPEHLARNLRQEDIPFVDAAGNIYINKPPLYIDITGRKRKLKTPAYSRAFHTAGLKILFLLIKDPEAASQTYRYIARHAGVALGAVGAVLKELESLQFLQTVRRRRILTGAYDLMNRWELAYADRLRPKLYLQTCRLPEGVSLGQLPALINGQNLGNEIFLGGELGASFLIGDGHPSRATLHITGDTPLKTMLRLRLIPHPEGNVELLRTFGEVNGWSGWQPEGFQLADPLLMHAEIMAQGGGGSALEKSLIEGYLIPRFHGESDE